MKIYPSSRARCKSMHVHVSKPRLLHTTYNICSDFQIGIFKDDVEHKFFRFQGPWARTKCCTGSKIPSLTKHVDYFISKESITTMIDARLDASYVFACQNDRLHLRISLARSLTVRKIKKSETKQKQSQKHSIHCLGCRSTTLASP